MLKAYPGSKYVPLPTWMRNLKKRTYTYKSLQFPVEINPFYTKYDLQGQSFDYKSLHFTQFLAQYFDFKTILTMLRD